MIDYRENQKVIATIAIEDQGQDFTELDVLENGVLLGESPMFADGIITLVGIGTLDGIGYESFAALKKDGFDGNILKDWSIYFKNSNEPDPAPWDAKTLKYKVVKTLPVVNTDRFIK